MALALGARGELELHIYHDERSASFAALGIGIESGLPAILLCTSGTAAVQFHAAAVEAHHAEVPMLICTADRPPELRGVGAPQTIDQRELFGVASRRFVDAEVPDDEQALAWRDLARSCLEATCGISPGPVQLNLPFREPLVGEAGELPPAHDVRPLVRSTPPIPLVTEVDIFASLLRGKRGVLVAGAGCQASGDVLELAKVLSWPVLADPRSGCQIVESTSPVVIAAADTFLRSENFARSQFPEVIVRFGEPPVSKILNSWLRGSGAPYFAFSTTPRVIDPDQIVTRHVVGSISHWCQGLVTRLTDSTGQSCTDAAWLGAWQNAESVAQRAIAETLVRERLPTEPAIARALVKYIPSGSRLFVSSSMPVRDLEWFAEPRNGLPIYANRGASGIDGVVSTAVGVALASHSPTYLLIGDIAMLHDSNGLIGLARRKADVRIVCLDNRGGGIFSFLPQATSLNVERFEQLFGTPHDSNIQLLAEAHGITSRHVDSMESFITELGRGGSWLLHIATNRAENVAVHERVNSNVCKALAS